MVSKLYMLAFVFVFFQASAAASTNTTFIRLPSRAASRTVYLLSSEATNFFKAFVSCQEAAMNLAAINTAEESADVDFALKNIAQNGDNFWLSGTHLPDKNSRQFYWFTGGKRAIYTDWLPGEPNNEDGVEDCLAWEQREESGVGWNDLDCTLERPYICQY